MQTIFKNIKNFNIKIKREKRDEILSGGHNKREKRDEILSGGHNK